MFESKRIAIITLAVFVMGCGGTQKGEGPAVTGDVRHGLDLVERNDNRGALAEFQMAYQQKPSPHGELRVGYVLFLIGDYEEAKAAYENYLKTQTDISGSDRSEISLEILRIGTALNEGGEPKGASLAKRRLRGELAHAQAEEAKSSGNYEEAFEKFNTASQYLPDPELSFEAALVAVKAEEFQDAQKQFKIFLSLAGPQLDQERAREIRIELARLDAVITGDETVSKVSLADRVYARREGREIPLDTKLPPPQEEGVQDSGVIDEPVDQPASVTPPKEVIPEEQTKLTPKEKAAAKRKAKRAARLAEKKAKKEELKKKKAEQIAKRKAKRAARLAEKKAKKEELKKKKAEQIAKRKAKREADLAEKKAKKEELKKKKAEQKKPEVDKKAGLTDKETKSESKAETKAEEQPKAVKKPVSPDEKKATPEQVKNKAQIEPDPKKDSPKSTLDVLKTYLKSPSSAVRLRAVKDLVLVPDMQARRVLEDRLLNDSSVQVRLAAADALVARKATQSVPLMRRAAMGASTSSERARIRRAIKQILGIMQ